MSLLLDMQLSKRRLDISLEASNLYLFQFIYHEVQRDSIIHPVPFLCSLVMRALDIRHMFSFALRPGRKHCFWVTLE